MTTKKALDQLKEGELLVIVDNAVSCNNVERFAQSQGVPLKWNKEERFVSTDSERKRRQETEHPQEKEKVRKVVVYINSHLMGGR
jgi:TusA-related sulfurtransferase